MRRLILIFMSVLNIVTSKTNPIDFDDLDIRNNISGNQWNKVHSKSSDMDAVSHDYPQLNSFLEHHNEMDTISEKINLQSWENPGTRVVTDPLNLRKTITVHSVYADAFDDFDDTTNFIEKLTNSDIDHVSTFLTRLLQRPSWKAPLIIVNEPPFSLESQETESESSEGSAIQANNMLKRSRYYRRNPFKGKKSKYQNTYDYDAIHVCMPTRDDVFQLLGALHDLRQGNESRNIDFCNRRRTLRTLLTHIRFLGRKK